MTGPNPRRLVALGARILARHGCDSNVGAQLSLRDAGGNGFWAAGFEQLALIEPTDVALVGWDLAVREGTMPMAAALRAHARIYERRPEVGAVLHTHAHCTTVLSTLGVALGMYDVGAVLFAGEQAVHEDDGTNEHVAVVDSLGPNRVVMIKNHGALFAAESFEVAVVDAVTFERSARIHLAAAVTGGSEIAAAEVSNGREAYRPGYRRAMWQSFVRQLGSELGPTSGGADP